VEGSVISHRPKITIRKNQNGTITLTVRGKSQFLDVRGLSLEEKYNRIKYAVIMSGETFTEKNALMVRKILGIGD
jgi:hypothetical protein